MLIPSEILPAGPASLAIIRQLASQLQERKIRSCVWKGSTTHDQVLCGKKDLDLLIDRADFGKLIPVVTRLGFKSAWTARRVPGVMDYLGCDPETGKLVHLHLHLVLVAGNSLTNNYRIPLERAILASRREGPLFAFPSTALEYILFVTRGALGQFHLKPTRIAELQCLHDKVRGEHVEEALRRHLPMIEPALFQRTCGAMLRGPSTGLPWRSLQSQWRQRLSSETRLPGRAEFVSRFCHRLERSVRRRLPCLRPTRMRLDGGARMILLHSGDAARAVQVGEWICDWLSEFLDVRLFPVGSSSASNRQMTNGGGRVLILPTTELPRAPLHPPSALLLKLDTFPGSNISHNTPAARQLQSDLWRFL